MKQISLKKITNFLILLIVFFITLIVSLFLLTIHDHIGVQTLGNSRTDSFNTIEIDNTVCKVNEE